MFDAKAVSESLEGMGFEPAASGGGSGVAGAEPAVTGRLRAWPGAVASGGADGVEAGVAAGGSDGAVCGSVSSNGATGRSGEGRLGEALGAGDASFGALKFGSSTTALAGAGEVGSLGISGSGAG